MGTPNRMKKRLLLTGVAVSVTICLLLLAIPLLSLLGDSTARKPLVFADPSLSADIWADETYLDLDRAIYLETGNDVATIRTALDEDAYMHQNETVQMLIRWILAARDGNVEAYNDCFAPEYIKKSGGKPYFTQQKLYDITIKEHSLNVQVPDGYEQVVCYGVRYKIKDNNGSLRDDMGSDAELEQYAYVVIDRSGEAHIWGIRTFVSRN